MTALAPLFVAEPPPSYLERPPLVVDCSAVAGLVFREPWFEAAQGRFDGRNLHAPHLLSSEIASVALKKHRRGETHALTGLTIAAELDIELHATDPVQVVDLAKRYGLSAYDAAYLWLAAELRCPLATFDEALARAATNHLAHLG
ncbi:type II toxin-antitoxin system VapC family toxin [Hydrogenophaga defluvii]|uniref:Ribonuclease VapC n=1 Tax=Hydrogenophaga defluvii TaxID=249410 RepID=A0ABW2SAQ7_9BURK